MRSAVAGWTRWYLLFSLLPNTKSNIYKIQALFKMINETNFCKVWNKYFFLETQRVKIKRVFQSPNAFISSLPTSTLSHQILQSRLPNPTQQTGRSAVSGQRNTLVGCPPLDLNRTNRASQDNSSRIYRRNNNRSNFLCTAHSILLCIDICNLDMKI